MSSHWTSSLDEVKVEEVDLDSSSEGGADAEPDVDIDERSSQHHQPQQQPQQHKEMEVSPSDDEDKGRVEQPENDDADEAAPALVPAPCLTLQSFARIPPLVAQDFNPPPVVVPPDFVNPDQLSGPTGPDDRRIAQDLQGDALDIPLPFYTGQQMGPQVKAVYNLPKQMKRVAVERIIDNDCLVPHYSVCGTRKPCRTNSRPDFDI